MKSCKCVFVGGRKVLRREEIYIYTLETPIHRFSLTYTVLLSSAHSARR